MGKKLCIGANRSAVLDFMKAGKCVSVSTTFFPVRFTSFSKCWFVSVRGSGEEAWGGGASRIIPFQSLLLLPCFVYGGKHQLCSSVLSKISKRMSLEEKTDTTERCFKAGCSNVNHSSSIHVSLEMGQELIRFRSQKRTEIELSCSS